MGHGVTLLVTHRDARAALDTFLWTLGGLGAVAFLTAWFE